MEKEGDKIGPKFAQEFYDLPDLRKVKFCKPKKENKPPDREPKKFRPQKGLDNLYRDYYYRHDRYVF